VFRLSSHPRPVFHCPGYNICFILHLLPSTDLIPTLVAASPIFRHAGPDPASNHAKSFAWGDSLATRERFPSAHRRSPAGPRLGGRGDGVWGGSGVPRRVKGDVG
jgi:hypothetical protein